MVSAETVHAMPAVQGMQKDSAWISNEGENVPAGQGSGSTVPSKQKKPDGQLSHSSLAGIIVFFLQIEAVSNV